MMPPASSDRMRRTRTVRVWSSMCTDSHSPRRANRVGVSCANGHAERLVSESGLLLLCRVTRFFLNAAGKKRAYDTIGRHGGRVEIEGRELTVCGGWYKEFRCHHRRSSSFLAFHSLRPSWLVSPLLLQRTRDRPWRLNNESHRSSSGRVENTQTKKNTKKNPNPTTTKRKTTQHARVR